MPVTIVKDGATRTATLKRVAHGTAVVVDGFGTVYKCHQTVDGQWHGQNRELVYMEDGQAEDMADLRQARNEAALAIQRCRSASALREAVRVMKGTDR